jgi:2-amino-4-hydroxy-6-hydroxymethyldihydropteridine diphosphokinase
MAEVYVALGSNVSPEKYLRRALQSLAEHYPPLRVSPAYRNRAVGFEGEDFINLVVGFSTADSPARVRETLQSIEASCDRQPNAPKWAARTMDIDILLYDDLQSSEPGLVIPRPDLIRRAYMLKPLFDIAPNVMHPTLKKPIGELWAEFDRDAHELVEVGEDWGLAAGGWR